MMIKEKTNGWERLKWLVSVPVVMGAMFVFAQPEVKDTLEEIAPVVNQEDTKAEIASLRQFYHEQVSAWEDRVRRPDGTVVLQSGRVHTLFITPESKVTLEEQVLTSNYQQAIQNFLREAKIADKKKTGKDEPQHILFKYSIKADKKLVLQVLQDIKAAYTELRAEYSRQGVKDIETVCPYVVSIEGPYEYWPGGVEITVTSADGSQKKTINEFKWKVFTQLRNELGPDSKVTFKVDKNAPEFMFKFVQDRLKDLFKNVQEEKAFSKKIDVSLFDPKSKSTLIDLKDLRYLSDLSKALNVLPKSSDISVSLKADTDTPMGDITAIKQALRENYIYRLNLETTKP